MAKIKKLLCMALAVALVASLFCLNASAAIEVANATFDDGAWPSNMSRTGGFLNTIPTGIYGKEATDYSPQAQAEFDAYQDRFFSVNDTVTIPDGGKLKISFDIAGEALTNDSANNYRHYVNMNLNGSGWKYLMQSNNVSCDTPVAINSHFNSNAWNNVTALFEFAEGNATSKYTLYVNGKSVYINSSFNPWATKGFAAWTSITGFRFGGHMLKNKLYYDNVVIETYTAEEESPSTAFALNLSESTDENTYYANVIVDETAKTVTVGNPDMTVADFKADAPEFTFVGENGATVEDTAVISDESLNLYAKYTNGINMYYVPYTVVVNRNYAITHETFTNGTFTTRANNSNGKTYDSDTLDWTGMSKATGVSIGEGKALGGKASDDSSLLMDVNSVASDSDPFVYISEAYVSGGIATDTHTFEAVLYKEDVDAADLQANAIDLLFGNQVAFRFYADGSVKTANATKTTNVTWANGTWLPIAVTYDKAANSMVFYAGGVKLAEIWSGAAPTSSDIRLRAFVTSGATFKLAIDDVKFYAGSLEKVRYDVDTENTTVVADATENLETLPIIAEYDSNDKLVGVTLGKTAKTIERAYTAGNKVKVFLINSLSELAAITKVYEAVK